MYDWVTNYSLEEGEIWYYEIDTGYIFADSEDMHTRNTLCMDGCTDFIMGYTRDEARMFAIYDMIPWRWEGMTDRFGDVVLYKSYRGRVKGGIE